MGLMRPRSCKKGAGALPDYPTAQRRAPWRLVCPGFAPSRRRLAHLLESATDMFGSAPLEAQLLAFLVMRHPGLFGIIRAEAASKQECRDSPDGNNAESHGNLSVGLPPANHHDQSRSPAWARNDVDRSAAPRRLQCIAQYGAIGT